MKVKKAARPDGSSTKVTKARRHKGASVVLVIFVTVVIGAWAVYRSGLLRSYSPADGPIILISIDTLRADHLPAYGYTRVRTPNIDALAAAGTVFEHAYSHAPQTLPAHTTILSGQLPFEHGVRDNVGFTVKPGQWFIQRALQERGWPTGGFVSAYVLRSAVGLNQGFDTYDSELPPASGERSIGQVQRDGESTLAAAEKWLDGARSEEAVLSLLPHLRAAQARTRRRRASPPTSRMTARSPTRTRSSAGCSTACAPRASTSARRSCCSPITAKGSAITASRSTGSFSTTRRCTSR